MIRPTFYRSTSQPLDLTVIREMLHEQREFRLEQLAELRRSMSGPAGTTGADPHGQVTALLAQAATAALVEIEAALTRLDRGGFGRCGRCADPIAGERLEIVPYARYCVSCQRQSQLVGGRPAGRLSA